MPMDGGFIWYHPSLIHHFQGFNPYANGWRFHLLSPQPDTSFPIQGLLILIYKVKLILLKWIISIFIHCNGILLVLYLRSSCRWEARLHCWPWPWVRITLRMPFLWHMHSRAGVWGQSTWVNLRSRALLISMFICQIISKHGILMYIHCK
jgi:hypothetical protein